MPDSAPSTSLVLARRRVHAFEFNDASWSPRPLRDAIVEGLSLTLRWGRMLEGLVAPFQTFLAACDTHDVLDLCAGAGGPARSFVQEFERAGLRPPTFVLTDLHPQVDVWEQARLAHPGLFDLVAEPVDATCIPQSLSRGRARVIINSFHHFQPHQARAILADAVACSAGIFIAEPFLGSPLGILPFAPVAIAGIAAAPILTHRDRLAKIVVTYVFPFVIAAVSVWDGIISSMRTYRREELFAMVKTLDDGYRWTYGHHRNRWGGRGYYFFGVPNQSG